MQLKICIHYQKSQKENSLYKIKIFKQKMQKGLKKKKRSNLKLWSKIKIQKCHLRYSKLKLLLKVLNNKILMKITRQIILRQFLKVPLSYQMMIHLKSKVLQIKKNQKLA